jgi:hypothetical protein
MAHNGYVQVPPDSTGKKIGHLILVELVYQSGTIAFAFGDVITGATSGAVGTVIKIVGTTATGTIFISLDYDSDIAFINAENLQVNAITNAIANGTGTQVYTPRVSLVDHDNPFNGANVSDNGELIISPAESPFSFDSFGSLRTKGENAIGVYSFRYGVDNNIMHSHTASVGGSFNSASNYDGVILSNGTPSGSRSSVMSHLYHPYTPGVGQSIISSVTVGDTGKAGVIRRWGYFDDNDGIFFELSASVFNTVIRNSSTGTIVEDRTPQTSWNTDRADGSGTELNASNVNLDVSHGNVYFMDFQWLGVGRVRFGLLHSGRRVIVHAENHNEELTLPWMSRPNLPFNIEQINYGTAGSTSELRIESAAVLQGTNRTFPYIDRKLGTVNELTVNVDWTGSMRPLFSTRVAQTHKGKENRSIVIPQKLSIYSENAPIMFQVIKWPTLTGDTWTVPDQSYSVTETDATATTASNGTVVAANIVPAGQLFEHIFDNSTWDNAFKIHRKHEIDDNNCAWTVVAKLLNTNAAPSSSVTSVMDTAIIL